MAVDGVLFDIRKMAESDIHACVHGETGISGFIIYKRWDVIRGLERAAYFETHNLWLPC